MYLLYLCFQGFLSHPKLPRPKEGCVAIDPSVPGIVSRPLQQPPGGVWDYSRSVNLCILN